MHLPIFINAFQPASVRPTVIRLVGICLGALSSWTLADDAPRPLSLPGLPSPATPEQDDATLHAVQLVGASQGWAAGDRGVIWKTTDGGTSWELISLERRPSGAAEGASPQAAVSAMQDLCWQSLCFLTDRVGWVAGGRVPPYGRAHQGVVLFTEDGGRTWQSRGRNLPYLRWIQFFDLERGIAVGERTPSFPGGVLVTADGGETWLPLNAAQSGTWRTAAFFSAHEGVVAGDLGRQALCANGRVSEENAASRGLQSFQAASADGSGRGWLAGDGSLLLTSTNRGVSWSTPVGALPKELADFIDFRCVSHVTTGGGNPVQDQLRRTAGAAETTKVWVSGIPGSIVWHSADAGETWAAQPTGDPAPLYALHFLNADRGAAVGVFGRISITVDGGKTWTTVRGGNRRLACLAVHTHADQVNFRFLARWAREEGYRTAVSLATRRDIGADAHAAAEIEPRLSRSVATAGGNDASLDWRLPLALPGLERNERKLVEEWLLLSDRRLPQVLLGNLVARIRMWRPSLIVMDEAEESDAATRLIHQAVLRAVEQSGNPDRYPEQLLLAGLAPWEVPKVVVQRRPGTRAGAGTAGEVSLDPYEVLPRLGTTLDLVAGAAEARFRPPSTDHSGRRDFLVLTAPGVRNRAGEGPSARTAAPTLFGDLNLSPDSAARRAVPAVHAVDYDNLVEAAKRRRTISNISRHMTAGPLQGGQLLGQLKEITEHFSREQAALQLAELAGTYRQHGQWALAEATYAELISHYSDQPVAIEAMVWLMHFWTSAEMNWQRLREIRGSNTQMQVDSAVVQANFERGLQIARQQGTETARMQALGELPSTVDRRSAPLIPTMGRLGSVVANGEQAASQQQMSLTRWQEMAAVIADGLEETYPRLAETPEIQFATAALMRRRQQSKRADIIYDRFLQTISDDPWHRAALGEAFLLRPGAESPKPTAICKWTRTPPVLDGRLDEPCWSDAEELRIGGRRADSRFVGTRPEGQRRLQVTGPEPIVMFCYDDEYLYVAASIPIHPDLPAAPPQLPGRQRDADLGDHDRLSLQFDVDRDYSTFYHFEVDQRGWTRDACWENEAYNPPWYVAAERDAHTWRIECAIPLDELLPPGNVSNSVWAIGVTRIMPGVGVASWTDSGGETPLPPLFGLLRFQPR